MALKVEPAGMIWLGSPSLSGSSSKTSGLPSQVGIGGMPRPGNSTPGSRKARPGRATTWTSAMGSVEKRWLGPVTVPSALSTSMPS